MRSPQNSNTSSRLSIFRSNRSLANCDAPLRLPTTVSFNKLPDHDTNKKLTDDTEQPQTLSTVSWPSYPRPFHVAVSCHEQY